MQGIPSRRLPACAGGMIAAATLLFAISPVALAADVRVLPEDKRPGDRRLDAPKTLNGYFPFDVPKTKEAWQKRRERVQRQVKVALGLWPQPTKTPLEAVVHGPVKREGYTVEKVYFQSFPGHFVTGNLYRPTERTGKLPGVLCPHGHWSNGRFHDHGPKRVREQIVIGAERFEVGGRHPLQARCVQLVRMGCVVFHYDMISYADSQQFKSHRPGYREHMSTPENWGYFSPQAELRCQNMMGLQTWNSIRALDFLLSLPEIDPERIAVTGASGGGTQTFVLGAVDPRPAVAFPAVMVSTAMQGGCTCENACYLRVDTGNIELAALFAPKPLGMTAADDWTKEIETKGKPELEQLYRLLGAKDRFRVTALTHFKHNYNYVSRAVMYHWLNEHLKLGFEPPVVEEDYQPLSQAEMSVWNDQHPRPSSGDDYERTLVKWITEDSQKQLAALAPRDARSLAEYRKVVGGGFDVLVGRGLPAAGAVEGEKTDEQARDQYLYFEFLIRHTAHGEELPVIFLLPKEHRGVVTVWVHEQGKAGLFAGDGQPRGEVRQLLAAGQAVVAVDLFGQGEFTADGQPLEKQRMVESRFNYAGYTFGYNHSLFAKRVHDVLTVLGFIRHHEEKPKAVHLVGLDGAGPIVAAASAQAGDAVDRTVVDTGGFRFAGVNRFEDPNYWPGSVKYGDLPGLVSLIAPRQLLLLGEKQVPAIVASTYQAAGKPNQVSRQTAAEPKQAAAAVEWLLAE